MYVWAEEPLWYFVRVRGYLMSHEFYLIDEIPLFLILLWAKELSFCHSLVETRLQIECQTPCQKHSQMYFQKHIQPKCVWGERGGQWLPTFCAMAIKLWPKDWQPQNHLSKSQIPCSTPSRDIYILNKIARWYGCFLRIEKHYPTVWEGVRNIFFPFSGGRNCPFGGWDKMPS